MDMVCSLPNLTLLQYLTLLCPFSLSLFKTPYPLELGFPGGSVVKNLPINAGDVGSLPGLGRCPGGENGNPLQYSHLENPMDRGP